MDMFPCSADMLVWMWIRFRLMWMYLSLKNMLSDLKDTVTSQPWMKGSPRLSPPSFTLCCLFSLGCGNKEQSYEAGFKIGAVWNEMEWDGWWAGEGDYLEPHKAAAMNRF